MPSYRLHQASGQAVVALDGSDVYLGPYGSIEFRRKYNQVVAEFTITGKVPRRQTVETPETTVKNVIAVDWLHAEGNYVKNGKPTSELRELSLLQESPSDAKRGSSEWPNERFSGFECLASKGTGILSPVG